MGRWAGRRHVAVRVSRLSCTKTGLSSRADEKIWSLLAPVRPLRPETGYHPPEGDLHLREHRHVQMAWRGRRVFLLGRRSPHHAAVPRPGHVRRHPRLPSTVAWKLVAVLAEPARISSCSIPTSRSVSPAVDRDSSSSPAPSESACRSRTPKQARRRDDALARRQHRRTKARRSPPFPRALETVGLARAPADDRHAHRARRAPFDPGPCHLRGNGHHPPSG